jgi:hypothetical protein
MIRFFWQRLRQWLSPRPKPDLRAEIVATNPGREAIAPGRLLVVGGRGYQKWAYLRCPCGCGEVIMLSLNQKRRPRWRVMIDAQGLPTVEPSVRQTAGCYSHFWIRRGKVEWCRDTGAPEATYAR